MRTEDVQQIGRVHNVHPNSGQLFYLRMLLHHIPANELALEPGNVDAFTFEALKYFEGEKHETYKGAATARNLLQDDAEWHLALTDAQESASAMQMRALYLAIVEYNQPEAPAALFDAFCTGMGDDFAHQMREACIPFTEDALRLRVMLELEETLESNGKSLAEVCGLQLDDAQRTEAQRLAQQAVHAREPKAIRDELTPSGERAALQAETDATIRNLLPAQKSCVRCSDECRHARCRTLHLCRCAGRNWQDVHLQCNPWRCACTRRNCSGCGVFWHCRHPVGKGAHLPCTLLCEPEASGRSGAQHHSAVHPCTAAATRNGHPVG